MLSPIQFCKYISSIIVLKFMLVFSPNSKMKVLPILLTIFTISSAFPKAVNSRVLPKIIRVYPLEI